MAVAQLMLVKMWGDTGIWMEGKACGEKGGKKKESAGKKGVSISPGGPVPTCKPARGTAKLGALGGGKEIPGASPPVAPADTGQGTGSVPPSLGQSLFAPAFACRAHAKPQAAAYTCLLFFLFFFFHPFT